MNSASVVARTLGCTMTPFATWFTRATEAKSFRGSKAMPLYRNWLMLAVPIVAISRVWPSGSAFATWSAPMLPPAPPRLSTMKGCPSAWPSRSASTRAVASVAPPARNGTISRTGWLGQAGCARGTAGAASSGRAPRTARRCKGMGPPAVQGGNGTPVCARTDGRPAGMPHDPVCGGRSLAPPSRRTRASAHTAKARWRTERNYQERLCQGSALLHLPGAEPRTGALLTGPLGWQLPGWLRLGSERASLPRWDNALPGARCRRFGMSAQASLTPGSTAEWERIQPAAGRKTGAWQSEEGKG